MLLYIMRSALASLQARAMELFPGDTGSMKAPHGEVADPTSSAHTAFTPHRQAEHIYFAEFPHLRPFWS